MKLSIIMPCYNVENTLIRALDSIAFQKVNFDYEVIIIDDASDDNTYEKAISYRKIKNINVFRNLKNHGNAYSYYTGLCNSKGDYVCVLDGDDYYTVPDKLQKQVDFLDEDTHENYVGVATQYIIDLGNGMVHIPEQSLIKEFSYADFLCQNSGYYHTATYMYRNIFRGNVPLEFKEKLYRGDTPRTMFHLKYSGKKIKVLDFIGSAYTFTFNGIWSGLKQTEQFEYQISYQTAHKKNVDTNFEKAAADRTIAFNTQKKNEAKEEYRKYSSISIDDALKYAERYAATFAFKEKDYIFKHVYYSEYLDSLCASLGYISLVNSKSNYEKPINQNNICIFNSIMNAHGGGIFSEILELISIYYEKNVYLFVTGMDDIPELELSKLKNYKNLTLIYTPKNTSNRLEWFRNKIIEISPYRIYYYCSHCDAYIPALIQSQNIQNIVPFSFDHGFLCGISNGNITTLIAKRPVDFKLLKNSFGEKTIYIPTWNKRKDLRTYIPFNNHKNLITASGAARYYKIDGKEPYRYADFVVELLATTKGIHYHFGELPAFILEEIAQKLSNKQIKSNHFKYMPWSENLPKDLIDFNVDIFIEPFPTVSYKLTLEALSVGIPIIAYKGNKRMSITDFIPDSSLLWKTMNEFIDQLLHLSIADLDKMSKAARIYFDKYHSVEKCEKYLKENFGVLEVPDVECCDDKLIDIRNEYRVFGSNYKISIMNSYSSECNKKNKELQMQNEIWTIRNSKRFNLGYTITLPLRYCKQTLIRIPKKGIRGAVKEIKDLQLMNYHRNNIEDELFTLKNSAAYKAGEWVAKIYWKLK